MAIKNFGLMLNNRTNLSFQVPSHRNNNNNNIQTNIALWGDMGTYAPLGFKVFEKIYNDYISSSSTKFNITILFGDISYAGLDTNVQFLNVTNDTQTVTIGGCERFHHQ